MGCRKLSGNCCCIYLKLDKFEENGYQNVLLFTEKRYMSSLKKNLFFLLISFCCFQGLQADDAIHQFFIGPEVYHVKRLREGGSKQEGWIGGVRLGYERFKSWGFYWGGDALWAEGKLKGHSALGAKLRSRFKDSSIEGRLGYTLTYHYCYCFTFTPFVGVGYFSETNNFVRSSPLPVHFRIHFSYGCGGFLSSFFYSPEWEAGINFKVKYPITDPKCHVTHDPLFEDSKSLVKSRFQYRVELPITYHYACNWSASLVPFYEYRNYGGHVNFPFDFLDTRLSIYGVTFKFIYSLY